MLKRKKTTTYSKRSAFNTLLGEGLVKKGNTAVAHKGCQTEPTNVNIHVSSHDVCHTHTEPKADSSHHTVVLFIRYFLYIPLTVRIIYLIFVFSSPSHSCKLL